METRIEDNDIRSLPFDEKARRFKSFALGIGMNIGGEVETIIWELGWAVVESHKLEGDAKSEFEEEMVNPIKNLLGQMSETNPEIKNAISLISSFEKNLF
jgi:hypothetical protein